MRAVSDIDLRQQRGTVRVLPEALKAWRTKHLHWTQKLAATMAARTPTARESGTRISPSTIAMLETGERQPSLLVAECIAEAYDLPVEAFAIRLIQPEAEVA